MNKVTTKLPSREDAVAAAIFDGALFAYKKKRVSDDGDVRLKKVLGPREI